LEKQERDCGFGQSLTSAQTSQRRGPSLIGKRIPEINNEPHLITLDSRHLVQLARCTDGFHG
jgi:hypothetical protein